MKGNPNDRKNGGKAIVNLKEKEDLIKRLSLTYYGNQLGVYLSTESIAAHSIVYCSRRSPDGFITQQEVIETAASVADIFKFEFLPKNDEPFADQIATLFKWVVLKGYGEMDGQGRLKINSKKKTQYLRLFLVNLLQAHIDSYLVVIYAIHCIMDSGIIIEQKKIVNELHLGIQEIFNRGGIQFMNSCLFEILNTAFGRYSSMGIC